MEEGEGFKTWGYNVQDLKAKQNFKKVSVFQFQPYFGFGTGKVTALEMFNEW